MTHTKTDVRTINEHIRNIFREGELPAQSVIRKFLITAADGKNYDTAHYNLDIIISVGYRVKSFRGTQFRIWATRVLRRHLVEGYTLNEKRLTAQQDKFRKLQDAVRLMGGCDNPKLTHHATNSGKQVSLGRNRQPEVER